PRAQRRSRPWWTSTCSTPTSWRSSPAGRAPGTPGSSPRSSPPRCSAGRCARSRPLCRPASSGGAGRCSPTSRGSGCPGWTPTCSPGSCRGAGSTTPWSRGRDLRRPADGAAAPARHAHPVTFPGADVEHPLEPLWRGLLVYRVLTLVSSVAGVLLALDEYASRAGALAVVVAMVAWTAASGHLYLRRPAGPDRRGRVAVADVVVTVAVM